MQGSADGRDDGRDDDWDDRWDDGQGDDPDAARSVRPGVAPHAGERTWVHPSEVGMDQRGRTDRRRGSLLAGGLVIGGVSLLMAGVLMGFGWGTNDAPTASLSPVDAVSPSLASLTVVRGVEKSTATGVLLDDDGHVAVRAGSVDGATEVWATCAGHAPELVQVVAVDTQADVAVVRVANASGRPVVDGPTPAPGAPVLMVRAGAGEQEPASWDAAVARSGVNVVLDDGTVSEAMFRTTSVAAATTSSAVSVSTVVTPLSDSSASAGTGTSDGAVFDGRGRFLGLVVSGHADAQDVVPAATIAKVTRSLLSTGRVERPWIGVRSVDVAVDADHPTGGAVIMEVRSASPAEEAGLRVGDVVTAVGDTTVGSMVDMMAALQRVDVGSSVPFAVLRDGARRTLSVTTATKPDAVTTTVSIP